jgi:hypothetical protein
MTGKFLLLFTSVFVFRPRHYTLLLQSESYTSCVYRALKLEDNRSAPRTQFSLDSRLPCRQDKRV